MVHPRDCPEWQYTRSPRYSEELLTQRAIVALRFIRSDNRSQTLLYNSRPLHGAYFSTLTPDDHTYFAGHYRGEDYRCLLEYQVRVPNDPRVGHPPSLVQARMTDFFARITECLEHLRISLAANEAVFSKAEKLHSLVRIGVALFVYFLEIHPYAAGNGHMSRMILVRFLGSHGFWARRLPIHPRPAQPFADLIREYRNGNRTALEHYVLNHL